MTKEKIALVIAGVGVVTNPDSGRHVNGLWVNRQHEAQAAAVFEMLSRQRSLITSEHRAGEALQGVARLFVEANEWSTCEILRRLPLSPKQIYNALGYLVRNGKIRRLAYGKYSAAS